MADNAAPRHALQYRGPVKSFSSKDILAQLAAAQQQSQQAQDSALTAAQPMPRHGGTACGAPHAAGAGCKPAVAVAQPKPADPKADNFHALQYKGAVKKFTSGAVRQPRRTGRRRPPRAEPCHALRPPARAIARAAQILNDFTRATQGEEVTPTRAEPAWPPAAVTPLVADVAPLIEFDASAVAAPVRDDWADFVAMSAQPHVQPPAQLSLDASVHTAAPPVHAPPPPPPEPQAYGSNYGASVPTLPPPPKW